MCHSCKVMPVQDDGFCFLTAIDLVVYCDFDEVEIVHHMVNSILEHLPSIAEYYKKFCISDLLWDTEGYIKFGNYCHSIIDIIIFATAKAPQMNLSMYQKGS